ncbi:MAG: cation transporter [Planctomycetales bacterium]|nr:cation transporter [Planctomycetales bacterium]
MDSSNNQEPTSAREFPEAIPLPGEVAERRRRRTSMLVGTAALGIGLRIVIILVELAGYYWLGHHVLLVDAVASLTDVLASFMILLAIKLAERPPDEDHPFGHGRYEPLAGLQMGFVILGLGLYLFTQQFVSAMRQPAAGTIGGWDWLIPGGAAVLLELTARAVLRSARRGHSTALAAEAYHYRIDALTSLVAAAGLILAAWLPPWSLLVDHLFAMILAGVVVGLGAMAAWENLHQIMDRVPDDEWFARVRAAAALVSGVRDVEKIRIQRAGPDAHVDIDIEVDPRLTVDEAHLIAQQVRAAIQTDWPAVREVVVHVEPFYEGDH